MVTALDVDGEYALKVKTASSAIVPVGGYDCVGDLKSLSVCYDLNEQRMLRTSAHYMEYNECVRGRLFSGLVEMTAATKNVENMMILFRNPSDSGKYAVFHTFRFASLKFDKHTLYRVYIDPTVTATGTAGSPFNRRVSDSPATSDMEFFALPTVSVKGTLINSILVGEPQGLSGQGELQFKGDLIVEPGHSILITCDPEANGTLVTLFGMWSEEG